MIAKQKGYAVRVIIPGEVAPSIGDLLELYGAEITWCEPRAGMKGAIDLALEMSREDGFHYVGQFDNPMNLQTHYATTGDEIARALPVVDVLVAGIGTGGTITGVGRRLREANPDVKIRRRAAYGGSLAGPPQPVGGLRAAFAGFEPAQPAVPGRQCHRH
jgi:cysteine synthase A